MARAIFSVKRLSPTATLPVKGSAGAAGHDISSNESVVIPARGRATVKTGLSITVPVGTYGRIAPRSGLAVKNGLDVGAGVVDLDYTGEVGVLLFNHSDVDYKVDVGTRIAQLILERIADEVDLIEVDNLDDTARGSGGFGSTGLTNLPA